MNTIVMSIVILVIVAIILIIGVLFAIQKKNEKGIKKQLQNLEIEKNKYLLMLDMEIKDLKKLSKDRVVKEYMEKIEKLNEDPIFINWITKEKDEQMIKNTQLYRATQNGINQGMKKEKISISKTLLNKNMSVEDIMDITGLTKEEIENCKR